MDLKANLSSENESENVLTAPLPSHTSKYDTSVTWTRPGQSVE